ncbi:hypothetical protein Tsubulata_006510 [Turnera subulata]|uniref:Charged multivesicular body protein 7 n=1 Tax=Turnera subulata TaxID=218843 RepID=A0A9Q0F7F8_9ROSI|nr:hypothetical protein Tsubulata_006510 [Turnera subulata]
MESNSSVKELIRKQVPDWDDETIATARFKAFNGQRSDWESKYQFWRDLILKTSRHLGLFIISASQVKNEWFNRGGLSPLCLDDVLLLMYSEGDIVLSKDVVDPTSGRISQLFQKMRNLMVRSTAKPELLFEEPVILTSLLKDKAAEIVDLLNESNWTSSCVVTMKKFQSLCGGPNEASAILSHLSGSGKAQYLSVNRKEFVEGVKISLSSMPVSSISSLDTDILHLIWTTEKLEEQIGVLDRRYETSRKLALAALNSGSKKVALRHARELKLASESREKCCTFLNRVEEILNVIANAESTKKVSEAIQIGAQAMKENRITVEEVEHCLEEFEEYADSQKQVEKALESTPSYVGIEDEDIEEEFRKLQLELGSEDLQPPIQQDGVNRMSGKENVAESTESADSLSGALLNLKLQDASEKKPVNQDVDPRLEAA